LLAVLARGLVSAVKTALLAVEAVAVVARAPA